MSDISIYCDKTIRAMAHIFKKHRTIKKNGKEIQLDSAEDNINRSYEYYEKTKSDDDKSSLKSKIMEEYAKLFEGNNKRILWGEFINQSDVDESDDISSEYNNNQKYQKNNYRMEEKCEVLWDVVMDFLNDKLEKSLESYNKEKNNSFLMYTLGFVRNNLWSYLKKIEKKGSKEISYDMMLEQNKDVADDDGRNFVEKDGRYFDEFSEFDLKAEDTYFGGDYKHPLLNMDKIIDNIKITDSNLKYAFVKYFYDYLYGYYKDDEKQYKKMKEKSPHRFFTIAIEDTKERYSDFKNIIKLKQDEINKTIDDVFDCICDYLAKEDGFPNISYIAVNVLGLNSSSMLSHSYKQFVEKVKRVKDSLKI